MMSFTPRLRPLLRVPPLHTLSGRAFSTTPQLTLAKLTIVGRLAAPPELITTQAGRKLIRYSLATTHGSLDTGKQVDWWRVSYFPQEHNPKLSDAMLELGKGSQLYVDGDAQTRKFEDNNGNSQTTLNIIQRNLQILFKKDIVRSEGESEEQAEEESEVPVEGGN